MPLILIAIWLLAAGLILAVEGASSVVVIACAVIAAVLALLAYDAGAGGWRSWRRRP